MGFLGVFFGKKKPAKDTAGYPATMRPRRPGVIQQPAQIIPDQIPEGSVRTPWSRRAEEAPDRERRVFKGTAFGSRFPSERDETAANQEKWAYLDESVGREFVYYNQPFYVHSTNVRMFQYWIKTQELYVEFVAGGAGTYDGVTEQEAIACTQAASKGIWLIDTCIGYENLKGHACWTKNGGHSIKPYRPGHKPTDIPMIPESAVTVLGLPGRDPEWVRQQRAKETPGAGRPPLIPEGRISVVP